jgi:hypothetical protein
MFLAISDEKTLSHLQSDQSSWKLGVLALGRTEGICTIQHGHVK